MKKLKLFIDNLDREIAFHAATNLLLCIGGIALFAFIATLHIYLIIPAIAFLVGSWYLLYKIELNWRVMGLRS